MVAPSTPVPDDCSGHIVTIFAFQTALGADDTFTIPAGLPYINLSIAHPVIGAAILNLEADADWKTSVGGFVAAKEMIRAAATTATGEFGIDSQSAVALYNDANKDSYYFLTYHAGGSKIT